MSLRQAAPAVLALCALLASVPAAAQAIGASAQGAASATVIAPIAVRQLADLDFGVVSSGGSASGQVVLAPGGLGADYGGGTRQGCGPSPGCPLPHTARFAVTGEANRAYAISAPQSVEIAGQPAAPGGSPSVAGHAAMLRVDGFRFRSSSLPDAGPAGQLDQAGSDNFDLGGTLHVPQALPPARYRVTVPVIVTYS